MACENPISVLSKWYPSVSEQDEISMCQRYHILVAKSSSIAVYRDGYSGRLVDVMDLGGRLGFKRF